MIRHVLLARFRPDADEAAIDGFLAAVRAVRVDGLLSLTCGRDAGLRPGTWDYAVVADLVDEAAYRRYDEDPAHRRIREEMAPGLIAAAERVQIVVPGA